MGSYHGQIWIVTETDSLTKQPYSHFAHRKFPTSLSPQPGVQDTYFIPIGGLNNETWLTGIIWWLMFDYILQVLCYSVDQLCDFYEPNDTCGFGSNK